MSRINLLAMQDLSENDFIETGEKIIYGENGFISISLEGTSKIRKIDETKIYQKSVIDRSERNSAIKLKYRVYVKYLTCKRSYMLLAKEYDIATATVKSILYGR